MYQCITRPNGYLSSLKASPLVDWYQVILLGDGHTDVSILSKATVKSLTCDCGQQQTMSHTMDPCPLTKFDGGLQLLHEAEGELTQSGGWSLQRLQHSQNENCFPIYMSHVVKTKM